MRRITSWAKLGLLLALGAVGLLFGTLFSGTQQTAAPVAQTFASPSRNAPGLMATRGVGSPVHGKPHELSLTRAHGAVFNVKNLKSLVVVGKDRPEHEDPLRAAKHEDMPPELA